MVFCGYGVVIFVIFYRKVTIHFDFPNGSRKTVEAKVGTNILDVVLDYDVDIDGFGMCSIFIVHNCLYLCNKFVSLPNVWIELYCKTNNKGVFGVH